MGCNYALNDIEREKKYAAEFIKAMQTFIGKNSPEMEKYLDNEFNTSLPKLFDNLIVVFVRSQS